MPATELVYVALDDRGLTALAIESEASGRSVEELMQECVTEFLNEKRENDAAL
jgi:hypothetical protein